MHDPRVIVALDYDNKDTALAFVDKLDSSLCKLKVGKEMFTLFGPEFVKALIAKGFDVFLDLKYHDIPNTVKKAVEASLELGVWMLNVHSLGGKEMLRAAYDSIREALVKPLILGVTILTSLDEKALKHLGLELPIEDQVLLLAKLCKKEGLDGVVCSPNELSILRNQLGEDFLLVTPGIRTEGLTKEDQKRTSTAKSAISNGANFVVIGREIILNSNPREKIKQILETV